MRRAALIALIVLAAGCGGGKETPPPDERETEPAPAPPAPPPEDVMQGVTFSLFPTPDTTQQNVKPLLTITAEQVTRSGEDAKSLSFEGAKAIVPAQTPDSHEIQFSAAHGTFVEGERAKLSGGVIARIDDMTITLEEILWEIVAAEGEGNTSGGVATSDQRLRIESPTQNLEADSLRLDTTAETIELRNVTGEITFIGDTP